jgi:hypothetical protein
MFLHARWNYPTGPKSPGGGGNDWFGDCEVIASWTEGGSGEKESIGKNFFIVLNTD